MKQFIGTKIINAQPAEAIMGSPEGMKVEYPDTGHVSWSPKNTFDYHYRPTDAMTFGQAMEAARLGEKVRRRTWTDTTYVFLETYQDGPVRAQYMQRVLWEPRTMHYPYRPSCVEMSAEDWLIVTPEHNRAMECQGNSLRAVS